MTGSRASTSTPAQAQNSAEVSRLISYVLIAGVAAFLFRDAGSLPASRWEPLGAGSFPRLVFGLLVVLCVAASAGSLRKLVGTSVWSNYRASAFNWLKHRYLVVLMFGWFALYLALTPSIGFAHASFGFLILSMLSLAPRTLKALMIGLVLALVFSYGLNIFFAEVFNVFLPRAR